MSTDFNWITEIQWPSQNWDGNCQNINLPMNCIDVVNWVKMWFEMQKRIIIELTNNRLRLINNKETNEILNNEKTMLDNLMLSYSDICIADIIGISKINHN